MKVPTLGSRLRREVELPHERSRPMTWALGYAALIVNAGFITVVMITLFANWCVATYEPVEQRGISNGSLSGDVPSDASLISFSNSESVLGSWTGPHWTTDYPPVNSYYPSTDILEVTVTPRVCPLEFPITTVWLTGAVTCRARYLEPCVLIRLTP